MSSVKFNARNGLSVGNSAGSATVDILDATGNLTVPAATISGTTSSTTVLAPTVAGQSATGGTLNIKANTTDSTGTVNVTGTNVNISGTTAVTGSLSATSASLSNPLPISSGGTNAVTAGQAITALAPGAATAGHVLTYNGSANSYSWAAPGALQSSPGTRINTGRQTYVATAGQTDFTGCPTYELGKYQLRVYINGVRQNITTDYTETTTTSFTLTSGATLDDIVLDEVDGYISYDITATSVSNVPSGNIAAITVQSAINELDTEKAAVAQTMYIGTTALTINRTSAAQALTGITSIDGTAAKATNLTGGNNTTLLGAIHYQSNTDVSSILSPNTTTTKKFLRQTGTGTNGAAPAWDTLVDGDIPSALTGKTYNALSLTAATTGFTVAGGTTSKTLTVNNSIGLSGTDNSTLSIGGNVTFSGAYAMQFTVPGAYTYTLPSATSTLLATNGSGSSLTFGTGSLSLAGSLTTSGAYGVTLTATATTNITLPTSGTLATTGNLSQFAATTSAQLAGVLSDETGYTTGAKAVFSTSPSFTTSINTGSTSFDLLNTTATTINIGGAATTINIGTTGAGTYTLRGTGATKLPIGTTAQRPSNAAGLIRYNSETGQFEGYTSAWGSIGGGATGAGGDDVFYLNSQTVTSSYSIPAGKNAMTAGPVTVNSGVTVTVPTGSRWVVV